MAHRVSVGLRAGPHCGGLGGIWGYWGPGTEFALRAAMRNFPLLASGPALALAFQGCLIATNDAPERDAPPVANNAREAWPTVPQNVPALGAEQVLEACAIAGQCMPEASTTPQETMLGLIDLCVSQIAWSAERAIPLSALGPQSEERAEVFVACISSASDCGAVNGCRTERPSFIGCEEVGCSAVGTHQISCEGKVASFQGENGTWQRDCERALAQCDPKSPTGCTDRLPTSCPAEGSRADRCEGSIRLGCDGTDRVSYRDCARLGGVCAEDAGTTDCVYPNPSAECVSEPPLPSACNGTSVEACVAGQRVSVEAPGICGG